MDRLNFPAYAFRVKNTENGSRIFDPVRKTFVSLLPEEWVRQHVLRYLNEVKGYPYSLMAVERSLRVAGTVKRSDLLVHHTDGSIALLVECKAPDVPLNQAVFDQIARYNGALRADRLMVTNGLVHIYCHMDYEAGNYRFIPDIPDFSP